MSKSVSRTQLIAAFAAVYIIWGSTYLAIRFVIESLPPFLALSIRFLLAGAILYAWERWHGTPRPTRTNWQAASLVGALLLLGGTGMVAWAEQKVPSGIASLLVATVPVWVVLIEWLRPKGVRPNLGVIAGLLVGFGGVVLLLTQSQPSGNQSSSIDLVGAGIVLLAALSWAAGSIYSRHAPMASAPLMAAATEMLAGGFWLLVLGTLTGEWGKFHLETMSWKSGLGLAYLVIFGSLVAFSAFSWLLKVSTPALVSTSAYVNPAVAVLLGWALDNESLGIQTLIAVIAVISGVILVSVYRNRNSGATTVNNSPEPEGV
jgi:drug/metabolite transporter (DMT)-like permease